MELLARLEALLDRLDDAHGRGMLDGARGLLAPAAHAAPAFALHRDGEVWMVEHGDQRFRLRDSRGMRILATLMSREGEEVHVTELGPPGRARSSSS